MPSPSSPPTIALGMSATVPRLLVSVRNADEATAALQGGCDLLDVKEPTHGPLGRADDDVLREILAVRDRCSPPTPASAALGELTEWSDRLRSAAPLSLPFGFQSVKVGLAGCRSRTGWRDEWLQLKDRLTGEDRTHTDVNDHREHDPSPLSWVLVAYADADRADAPAVEAVLAAAWELPCQGVLIDTWDKQSGRLSDWLSPREICEFARQCSEHGRWLAVAGRLQEADLTPLVATGVEVIAVRSAACAEGNRTGPIHRDAVARLKSLLRSREFTPT